MKAIVVGQLTDLSVLLALVVTEKKSVNESGNVSVFVLCKNPFSED